MNRKKKPEQQKAQDKLLQYRELCIKAVDMSVSILTDLEGKVKTSIRDSQTDYAGLLAVKGVLDHTMSQVSEIQEIDGRIRRLISVDNDFMERASNAFPFEPDRIISE